MNKLHALTGFEGVRRLSDNTGILQHSRFAVPDRDHGYCLDDNARALLLLCLADDLPLKLRRRYGTVYAAFMQHAWNANEGRFRNFMAFNRSWLEDVGSDDSNGRAFWVLAVAECSFPDSGIREWAATLLDEIAPTLSQTSSPRTAAFLILGAEQIVRKRAASGLARQILENCAAFLLQLYESSGIDNWDWFETSLAYDNARLPEAVLRAAHILDDKRLEEVGLQTLRWLRDRQTDADGMFCPVGTEQFGTAFARPARYDQQPLEAWATIDACLAARQLDASDMWIKHAQSAFAWFTGANVLGLPLASTQSGECFDGIGPHGINLNRGAESVLAWQCACRRIALIRQT